MADIYEKQDLFWAEENPLCIIIELIEIGIFGMIFIAADEMLEQIIDEFFDGEMTKAGPQIGGTMSDDWSSLNNYYS